MPCYQQERFVGEAVQSILAQDYQPLEIIISDDASNDDTPEIISKLAKSYKGPHRVAVYQQKQNSGTEHYEKLRRLASGEILIIAHGDDIAYPDRVDRLVAVAMSSGASLVTSNAHVINERKQTGKTYDKELSSGMLPLKLIVERVWTKEQLMATMAVRRELLDEFPPFNNMDMWQIGDHVLPFRAAMMNGVYYIGNPLMAYRDHKGSITSSQYFTKKDDPGFEYSDLSRRVGSQRYRLMELAKRRHQYPNDEKLLILEQRVNKSLERYLENWHQCRNHLLSQGRKVAWLTKKEQTELAKIRGN